MPSHTIPVAASYVYLGLGYVVCTVDGNEDIMFLFLQSILRRALAGTHISEEIENRRYVNKLQLLLNIFHYSSFLNHGAEICKKT